MFWIDVLIRFEVGVIGYYFSYKVRGIELFLKYWLVDIVLLMFVLMIFW